MSCTPFFLTPHQGRDPGVRISQDPFEPGAGPESREAVEGIQAGFGLHKPRPYDPNQNVSSFQRAFTVDKRLKMTHTKPGRPYDCIRHSDSRFLLCAFFGT